MCPKYKALSERSGRNKPNGVNNLKAGAYDLWLEKLLVLGVCRLPYHAHTHIHHIQQSQVN